MSNTGRLIIVVALVVGSLLSAPTCQAQSFNRTPMFINNAMKAYADIHSLAPNGNENRGGGIFISDYEVLTVAHLWQEDASYFIGDNHEVGLVFVRQDRTVDLMLLRAEEKHDRIRVGNGLELLEEVLILGSPLRSPVIALLGRVAGLSEQMTLIDSVIIPGMSGGPIVSLQDGKLVGITQTMWGVKAPSRDPIGPQMLMALRPELIKTFLEEEKQ